MKIPIISRTGELKVFENEESYKKKIVNPVNLWVRSNILYSANNGMSCVKSIPFFCSILEHFKKENFYDILKKSL